MLERQLNSYMQVKICGNVLKQDIELLYEFKDQVTYIGFIFTPISKRYVTAQLVGEWLDSYPFLKDKAVGVFLNQELEEVINTVKLTGIKQVQLHGDESPEYCSAVKKLTGSTVWKVIPIHASQISDYTPYLPIIDTLLLDTKVNGQAGGTGTTFDWSLIPKVYERVRKKGIPLWVAGGINPTNIVELMKTYPLSGVDVSSGVEGEQGKDKAKIRDLLRGVESNEATCKRKAT